MSLVRTLKDKPELKMFEVSVALAGILDPSLAKACDLTTQFVPVLGTDIYQRIGRRVQIQGIRVHGCWFGENITTVVEPQQMGFQALVLDRGPDGTTAPAMGDIWRNPNSAAIGTNGFTYRNPNTRKRYKILKMEEKLLPQLAFITQAGVGAGTALNTGTGVLNTTVVLDCTQKLTFDYYISAKKAKIGPTIFNQNNAGIYSDVEENGLMWWFWVGNCGAATTNQSWGVTMCTRVTYTDA